MDLSSQRQYIQRAINVKYSFSATTQQTIYTAPSGGDFDFAIIKSFLACDHGNQQTKNCNVEILKKALKNNPAGNEDQKTPFVLVRPC